MRTLFVRVVAAVAVIFVTLPSGDAQAPPSPQGAAASTSGCVDAEKYTEDFESGWASNWYLATGFQIASAGAGKNLAGGGASATHASYLSGDYWANFYFGLKLKLISGETRVSFRNNTDDSAIDLPYDRLGSTVSHRYYAAFAATSASLVRDDAGTLRVLGSASTSLDPSRSYTIGIFAVGDKLSLYVDNALLISVTDASPIASGSIALETLANASAQFDDLQVVANVPCEGSWTQTKTFPTGVDVNVISFNPSDSNTVYVGTEHAGVWNSSDGGLTWAEVGYSGEVGRLGKTRAVVVGPSDAKTVYAAWVGGVDRSVDGGVHWTRTSIYDAGVVQAMAADPSNANVIYVGVGEGGGGAFSLGALYKSSDAGATYQTILSSGVYAIAIPTSAPSVIYVRTKSGISKSTDSGATWAAVYTSSGTSIPSAFSLVVDPSNSNTVYAVESGVIKSTNGGATWSTVRSGGGAEIVICRAHPEVLYLIDGSNILRTGDGGTTWTATAVAITTKPYTLAHVGVDPTNPDKLFAGTWGQGIFVSTDRGATWSEPTMFAGPADLGVAVGIHPNDGKTVYVGTSKGEIYRTADAGDTWSRLAVLGTGNLYQSLITGLVINPSDPAKIFASNLEGIYKSSDGGITWKTVNTGLTDSRIITLAIDPKNPDRLYAGTGSSRPRNISDGTGMFYSVNGGESWSAVSGFPAAPVPSIAVSASNPNVIYAAAIGYGAYKSSNAGASWTQVNSGLESQTCLYTLAVDPQNADVAYAGTSNTSYCKSVVNHPDNVYKTTDGGQTWKISRKGETIFENIESIVIDPSNSNNIYATNHTERIWFSGDAGTTWKLANQNVVRHGAHLYLWALAIDSTGNSVYLVTCGRGVLKNSIKTQESASTTGPVMGISPSALRFAAINTGGTLTSTSAQSVTVSQTGSGTVAWNAAVDQSWVTLSPTTGSSTGTLRVTINNTGGVLPSSGNQSATITVALMGASNTSLSLPLTLTLYSTGSTSGPYGSFDTPANGAAGVVGAIPVTGWSLDDVGVDRVELWRNCVETIDRAAGACAAAAPGGAADFVFIGRGVFLAGARPDVEASFATSPMAYRAGWGYLMLTNALPHLTSLTREGGQGTFTLSAYAVDVENRYTRLGTKTITLDNDHATIPFGAIDTPEQGGTVPGSTAGYDNANAYPNFGWAMTQIGKCIDTASVSAYRVYIDGVARTLTPGSNWFPGLNRSDIAAAYPGYCNTTTALAAYYVNADALGLANGLHTIGWDAIDNQGKVAGIGSRFFIVSR